MFKKLVSLLTMVLCTGLCAHQEDHVKDQYAIRLITGKELQRFTDFVANQRIAYFKGYPYLYEGTLDEQHQEISWYFEVPLVALAVAFYGDTPVAYMSGVPLVPYMERHFPELAHRLDRFGLSAEGAYHIAEVVVLKEHRGQSLVGPMFERLETYAKNFGFKTVSLDVIDQQDHALRPKNYRDPAAVWRKFGYEKTGFTFECSWNTEQVDGSSKTQAHILDFWSKALDTDGYAVQILTGDALAATNELVAKERIRYYRGYPYLYEGNMQEELEYLNFVSNLPQSARAIVYRNGNIIAFATGSSLVEFEPHFVGSVDLFKSAHKNPHDYYYIADDIVMAEYEDKGFAERLFDALEQHAQSLGYKYICIVHEEHDIHPLKPQKYRDFDWAAQGYTKTNIAIHFTWNTLQADGTSKREAHELPYWIKQLHK